ncbi:unnamed protein product [Schistocephalus solidus]|uniref:Uncharacterized protein n=1 Tax=Schistocephalus solidus TaxID=70667 RepID=A0A183SK60_SCHSO|nr:unnamed protein product [Schistocephalus solidus]
MQQKSHNINLFTPASDPTTTNTPTPYNNFIEAPPPTITDTIIPLPLTSPITATKTICPTLTTSVATSNYLPSASSNTTITCKKAARKSQAPRINTANAQALPTCPRCECTFRAGIGLVGQLRTKCKNNPTTSTSATHASNATTATNLTATDQSVDAPQSPTPSSAAHGSEHHLTHSCQLSGHLRLPAICYLHQHHHRPQWERNQVWWHTQGPSPVSSLFDSVMTLGSGGGSGESVEAAAQGYSRLKLIHAQVTIPISPFCRAYGGHSLKSIYHVCVRMCAGAPIDFEREAVVRMKDYNGSAVRFEPGDLGGPRPEPTCLKKDSEDRGSNLRRQQDRRRQGQKSGTKVTSAPDQQRQCPGPSNMPTLSTHIPCAHRPGRTSSDAMHQQSDNSKFHVTFCDHPFGLPLPHPWHHCNYSRHHRDHIPTLITCYLHHHHHRHHHHQRWGLSPKLSSLRPHIHLTQQPGRSLANPLYRD